MTNMQTDMVVVLAEDVARAVARYEAATGHHLDGFSVGVLPPGPATYRGRPVGHRSVVLSQLNLANVAASMAPILGGSA